MVQGMGIAFLSPVIVFNRSVNKNYKLKNLLAKVEKVLAFLSLAFFNLEKMFCFVIILKFFVYNSNCAWATLKNVSNNGGLI